MSFINTIYEMVENGLCFSIIVKNNGKVWFSK